MNDFQVLINIRKHIDLNDLEAEHLTSHIKVKEIRKKDILLNQGQVCRKLYFVETGSLRAFHNNSEGKESTIMFAIRDWWITDMHGFVNQSPALLSIEALEDSIIIELDFDTLEKLYLEIPKFERFFRILFQKAYIREQLRALYAISCTTEERYRQFLKKYPAIVAKISQKQIASYLGVTPEFLSSIKKK